ncbi:MAG: hypothetical protein KDK33_17560 [Leptospiraceae bacterium]|nr:hypothetical protein [Leptospiraceae bacterium]
MNTTESLPALISGESLDNVTAHYRAFRSGLNREEGEKTAETRQAVNRVMVGEDLEVQALMGQEIETRYSLGRLSYELGESVVTEVATLGAMKAFTAARMSLKSMRAARASRAFSVLNSGKRLLTGLRYGRISRTAASVAQKMPTAIGTGIRKLGTSIAGNYRRLKASQMLVNGLIDGTKSVAIEQTVRTDLPLWSKQSAVTFGFAFATGGFGTHLNNPFKNGLMSMTTNYFGQKSVQAFVDPGYEVSYGQMLLTGALSTGSAWTERYLHEEFSGGAGLSKGGRLWGAKWSNGVPWLGIEVGVAGITEYLNES